ncbi:hypothetical protein KC332_g18267 [Hortaea werneckii]|nr:hypothetical protein KC350_g18424 [Hortaea werneckii]KAI6788639.1 hypothetical protein KC358_g18412 [Hortaea werneckii]KAI6895121.1 hypothetical protein KC348_g18316 [Hortaea werneckii]KAI6917730.1 hypothetical protein KC341_g18370 [Hortaea werneckii]KAI6950495.1 hypothetical protein KC321_g18344 [Hortaea werneckii]
MPSPTGRLHGISIIIGAVLGNVLALHTLTAMSATAPWLAQVASLTIRFFGVHMLNHLEIPRNYTGVAHLAVMALGWAVNKALVAAGIDLKR